MTTEKNSNGLVDPRNPHPVREVANLDQQIAELTARRNAIQAIHNAAGALIELGYTRRQVRAMAGFDLSLTESE